MHCIRHELFAFITPFASLQLLAMGDDPAKYAYRNR